MHLHGGFQTWRAFARLIWLYLHRAWNFIHIDLYLVIRRVLEIEPTQGKRCGRRPFFKRKSHPDLSQVRASGRTLGINPSRSSLEYRVPANRCSRVKSLWPTFGVVNLSKVSISHSKWQPVPLLKYSVTLLGISLRVTWHLNLCQKGFVCSRRAHKLQLIHQEWTLLKRTLLLSIFYLFAAHTNNRTV